MNDDCVLHPDALQELLTASCLAETIGSVAACGPLSATNPRHRQLRRDRARPARRSGERRLGEPASAVESDAVEVLGASGTLGLYRRQMLEAIGGFDASFFAYLEDADLAWRARMAGWRCVLAPAAIAFHHHSATLGHGSAAKHRLVGRNRVRMLAKNASTGQLRRRLLPIVAYDLLYVGYVAATGKDFGAPDGPSAGLAEWRRYRASGRPGRRDIDLPPSPGLRAALARNRVYGSLPPV